MEGRKPLSLTQKQRFEALRMRYEDQAVLLRSMTGLDLSLVSGIITSQIVLGSWLVLHPMKMWPLVGVLILDGIPVLGVCSLLKRNADRRREAVATLKNIMAALGFYHKGFYIEGLAINPRRATLRLWGYPYAFFTMAVYVGLIVLVLVAGQPQGEKASAGAATHATPSDDAQGSG